MTTLTYPKYYNVDDLPVVLELDGKDVVGKTIGGKPYPIGKAMVEGYEITKQQYNQLAKKIQPTKTSPSEH